MNRFFLRKWVVASGAIAVGSAAFISWTKRNKNSVRQPGAYNPSTVECTSNRHGSGLEKATTSVLSSGEQTSERDRVRVAIERSRLLLKHTVLEKGIPGAVVAVSKNGETVWTEGFGYADVENDVPCTPETVMRIASISKPLSAVALLQLWQKGLVDLDAPIQKYVPSFPQKEIKGKPVDITTRHLLSHRGGIRHYRRDTAEKREEVKDGERKTTVKSEFNSKEYYVTAHFNSVKDALRLFAEDDLVSEPGTSYHYTTHGWTLISAVIEAASGEQFLDYMKKNVFGPLGMAVTVGEFHEPLVYNRARHYVRDAGGRLKNTPYVDNSYKWAGGGLISNAEDLLKFGNAMLVCYQLGKRGNAQNCQLDPDAGAIPTSNGPTCLLDGSTTAMMWKPVVKDISSKNPQLSYGMGWYVRQGKSEVVGGRRIPFCVGHTGGAVGASSALVIIPKTQTEMYSLPSTETGSSEISAPEGVTVALIFNLQEVKGMFSLGVQIAEEFV